jgi:site-specific recombinase XerD
MRAGFSQTAKAPGAKDLAARDQALLWVLFETGITVSELYALRLADLDQHTGLLWVRGKGGKERQLSLGPNCLNHLRAYMKQMEPTTKRGLARRRAGGDPLFASKGKQPLTPNGVAIVFTRFRVRTGIRDATISPQILRHSFALRYLQAGKILHGTMDDGRSIHTKERGTSFSLLRHYGKANEWERRVFMREMAKAFREAMPS